MNEEQNHHLQEEYAQEISPGSRQDIRKEEGSNISFRFVGTALFVFALLLLLFYLR